MPQLQAKTAHKAEATRRKHAPVPSYEPQLATLVSEPPQGKGWIHELKYDGYRMGCIIQGKEVRLHSRNGKDWTDAFPEVVAAAHALKVKSALLDGEVALVDGKGHTNFQALQNSFSGGTRAGITFFVFDLLYLDGEDLRALPLLERKTRLARLAPARGVLRFADHVTEDGQRVLTAACQAGGEGIVSKRSDRPYRAGRNDDWQKSKCLLRQEFVVGGFTEPEGSRAGIGALLLGYHEGKALRFAGKVGTGRGFTGAFLSRLRQRLDALTREQTPFSPPPPTRYRARAHWVTPSLIVEVAFSQWTDEKIVRHASMQGLREDKSEREVTREQPKRTRTKRN